MRIHMIGIGGIGMSALAQYFAASGSRVRGSDREASPTTELLGARGIDVVIGQRADNLSHDTELVVYSDAVPAENPERAAAAGRGVRQISYFEALGEVTHGRTTIAVAGTHGKTTTTAMLTKILADAGESPTAVIGSLVREFGSNFVSGEPEGPFIVEACEYKDHILRLAPTFLVITNIEWDHTDWFPSLTALQDTFREAVHRVRDEGVIVANPDDPNVAPVLYGAKVPIVDYTKGSVPELAVIGEFNRMNARAAKAAARAFAPRIPEADIDRSLAAFTGSWRRFEYKGMTKRGAPVYDDYAHHPTAIRETLAAAKQKFFGKKLVVAFHPHLYTRTRDLMEGFAAAFGAADEVFLAPIYGAREEPISGVTSEALAGKVQAHGVSTRAASFLDIERELAARADDSVVITMGAGDIYKVAESLTQG